MVPKSLYTFSSAIILPRTLTTSRTEALDAISFAMLQLQAHTCYFDPLNSVPAYQEI